MVATGLESKPRPPLCNNPAQQIEMQKKGMCCNVPDHLLIGTKKLLMRELATSTHKGETNAHNLIILVPLPTGTSSCAFGSS